MNTAIKTRDGLIDFLRGIAIIDMMLVHFAPYWPVFLSKLIVYHDVAIEGFIFLSGYSVGRYYYKRFTLDGKSVTRRFLQRAGQLVLVQFLLIGTISVPHFMLTARSTAGADVMNFIVKSCLFYNQVGLLHILPTFIPLFLLSPVILYLLSKGRHGMLLIFSLAIFAAGQINPYLLDYGERRIFPVILWQIWFVIGCVCGQKTLEIADFSTFARKNWVIVSCLLFIPAEWLKNGPLFKQFSQNIRAVLEINFDKFPLNAYGLLYGICAWFLLFILFNKYWKSIQGFGLSQGISLLGRHSMLVFVVHLYFAKVVEIVVCRLRVEGFRVAIYLLIAASFITCYFFAAMAERRTACSKAQGK
jgi:hypothetical protein